jgi:voltage-gated potassium channel
MSYRPAKSFLSILDDVLMIALALLSAGLLALEFSTPLTSSQLLLLDRIDLGIALVFLAEFVINFSFARNKAQFFKTHWWELLASIPITTPQTQALRLLRLLRLVRLLRLNEGFREIFDYLDRFFKQTHLFSILTIWVLIVCAGAGTFYAAEHTISPQHPDLFDSFWWSVATITTVGYGDVYPVTNVGRIAGMMLMLCGIGTTGIFTALIASFFIKNRSHKD